MITLRLRVYFFNYLIILRLINEKISTPHFNLNKKIFKLLLKLIKYHKNI